MLREALETQMGRLKDFEVPSKSLVASKMDDVELNVPRVEDLRDVSSIEDGEADVLQGSLDASTGTFKMKPARATVLMPKNPEELRQGDEPTLEAALTKAMKDSEVMNLHFIILVTTTAASSASSSSRPAARPASPAGNKGGSKGKSKGGARPAKKLHVKTPDGRPLCFKLNNNGKCTAKNCNYVHQCQRCLGAHPKSSCNSLKKDTDRAPAGANATD
eukprot:s1874_g18.t1